MSQELVVLQLKLISQMSMGLPTAVHIWSILSTQIVRNLFSSCVNISDFFVSRTL